MNKKLKTAVVGLTIGAGHAKDYASNNSVGEVVLCDVDKSKLDEVGEKYGIAKKYTDYAKMLEMEKPDAVSVAVPNNLHLPFTVKALESGAHVLCEKPMARNSEEAEKMLNAAIKCNKKLMINFNQRFQKQCVALKAVIDQGKLGDIYFARTVWQRRRGVPWWYPLAKGIETCGGGALIDLGVHVLDRAMWFCGYPEPDWILGNTFNKVSKDEAILRGIEKFELDDMGVAMIRMTNGMLMEIEASWASNRENEVVSTRLYGSKGGAVLRSVVGDDKAVFNQLFLETNGVLEDFPIDEPLTSSTTRQAFIDAIINDTDVPCTPQQGLKINRMLDAIYESGEIGKPVKYRE